VTTIGRRVATPRRSPADALRFHGAARFAPCAETDALMVRHGIETRYGKELYRESFAADCWAAKAEPATIRLGHDGADVGRVIAITPHREWHHASFVVDTEDNALLELAREQIVVGAKVSLDCRSLKPHKDDDLRLVRHTLAWLNHIAIVQPDEVAGHPGAIVTTVWQSKPKPFMEGEVITGGERIVRCGIGQVLGVR
jgi:hypothetical protein